MAMKGKNALLLMAVKGKKLTLSLMAVKGKIDFVVDGSER